MIFFDNNVHPKNLRLKSRIRESVKLEEEADEDGGQEEKRENGSEAVFLRMLKTRTILVSGEINKTLAEKTVRELLLLENAGAEPINLFIDSPGGDADAGFAIFDMIRFVKPEVRTIGMGLVASAAAIILLAANRENRAGLPNSHYLIHQPSSGVRGVATEIEIHAQEIEKMRMRINQLIASETDRPETDVARDTDRDFWMNVQEAREYGLVSKLITHRADL